LSEQMHASHAGLWTSQVNSRVEPITSIERSFVVAPATYERIRRQKDKYRLLVSGNGGRSAAWGVENLVLHWLRSLVCVGCMMQETRALLIQFTNCAHNCVFYCRWCSPHSSTGARQHCWLEICTDTPLAHPLRSPSRCRSCIATRWAIRARSDSIGRSVRSCA
jgi:hypothetical protein